MNQDYDHNYNEKPVKQLTCNHFWIGDARFKCGKCQFVNTINCLQVTCQELSRTFDIDNPNKVRHQYFYYFECSSCYNENIINPECFQQLSVDANVWAKSYEDIYKLTNRVFYKGELINT